MQELKVDDLTYRKIQQSPRFQQLVRKRSRFAWALSVLMLAIYLAFILAIAFEPQWLGTPIGSGTIITWGIPVGVGIIVAAFVLTGVYVWRANGEFDRMTAELLKELEA
ncbi:DUF485 domain-containing protein [Pseudoxanthomonas composti]|uniref:DUF485 domain-containing protein n=1 Tax=Pseudoxanthomonas composti TaxID=2137479 RepID=UPI0026AC2895